MVNTKHILKSVVPQGSNFDSYPFPYNNATFVRNAGQCCERADLWLPFQAIDRLFGAICALVYYMKTKIGNRHTLWLLNLAMENGPFIDGSPIKNGDFPWLC